jgi:hypothetical protein
MNDKYFDGNLFEELPADHFHKKVLDHAACTAANLMFDAAHPDHTGGVKSANASPILKLSGKPVVLTVAYIQDELPLDYDEEDEGEPLPFDRPANVDAETGEVYEVITDEARMIGDGE